eukprot:8033752-Alexandrium_andersonii.AAC.1
MAAQWRPWQKVEARRPRDAAGATAGVDVSSFYADLPKEERLAGLVRMMARGAIWTQQSMAEAGYATSGTCPRRGEGDADEWH